MMSSEYSIDDGVKSESEDTQDNQHQPFQNSNSLLSSYLSGNSKNSPYSIKNTEWKWSGDLEDQFLFPPTTIMQEPLDFSVRSRVFSSPDNSYQSISDFSLESKEKFIKMEPLDASELGMSKEINTEQMMPLLSNVKKEPSESMSDALPLVKKRGRKKQQQFPGGIEYVNTSEGMKQVKQEKITDTFKPRKKIDRFEGMSEEDVMKKTLPDHLIPGLDIVIIGINPGLTAAFKGHHYAGPGNHFWKCLFLAGLIPEPMTALDDYKLLNYGIGFTNIVSRTTRGCADLTRKEIKEGGEVLLEKLKKYQPKIAVFNGKTIYEVFSGSKTFDFGRQPDPISGTDITIFVMPSSSARCAQLPRAADKVPFYVALKKLRDYLCGLLPHLDLMEVSFPDLKLKVEVKEELLDYEGETNAVSYNENNAENRCSQKKKLNEQGRKNKQKKKKNSVDSFESWSSVNSDIKNCQQWQNINQTLSNQVTDTANTSDLINSSLNTSFGTFSNDNQNITSSYFSSDNKTYFPQNYSLRSPGDNRIKLEPFDPGYGDF